MNTQSKESDNKKLENDDLRRRHLGAFWVMTSKNGETYLSGEINLEKITGEKEVIRVNILKNKQKMTAKHPDYGLFLQRSETAKDFLADAKELEDKEGKTRSE